MLEDAGREAWLANMRAQMVMAACVSYTPPSDLPKDEKIFGKGGKKHPSVAFSHFVGLKRAYFTQWRPADGGI